MTEAQTKTVRDVVIVNEDVKVRQKKIGIVIHILVSSLFPFLWIDLYRSYLKWASSFMREKARMRFRFYFALAASLTFSLVWLYFGGSLGLLLSMFLLESGIIAAFLVVVFIWLFFHADAQPPAHQNKTVSAIVRLRLMARMARSQVGMFRRPVVIVAMLGLVATILLLKINERNPFPAITLFGSTDSAARQLVFLVVVGVIFDVSMTVFCWHGFKREDRTPLIQNDKTISFREAKDPTPDEFYLGAVGKGYIPPVPLSFDFGRFEQNFMIFGGPNLARENMVNWLFMCAFADPNTIAVCIDGGRNDDIAFRHLRNVPGVFIAEINDSLSNTYSQIIRWVCWLADLADEAFMKRHGVRPRWRPEGTRIVVFCDPEITDIVMKKNLRKVGKNRITGKIKVIWQHPLYDIVEPLEKLFNYGKSHNITFVCVAKHQYHQLSVPKDKRDAFYNIVYNYNVNDILPDGTEGWITVKTPPFKHTFGVNFRNEFIVGTAPEVRNEDLADYIRFQMQDASAATLELCGRAGDEVPSRPIIHERKPDKWPVIRPGVEWYAQPRDMNADNGKENGRPRKHEKSKAHLQET